MVVSMVKDSGIIAKMRAGVKTGASLAEARSTQRYRSLCVLSDRRRRFLKSRAEKELALKERREQRRKFFKENAISKLPEVCPIGTRHFQLTPAGKKHVNTIIGINKKHFARRDLLPFMDVNGKFPTRRMARRYYALGRAETRKFERQQVRRLRKMAKKSNIYSALYQYDAPDFTPLLHHLDDETSIAFGPRIVPKKVSDFNPKQNFVYKSHKIVPAHPYAGLSFRHRLQMATLVSDFGQINLLRKYRNKLDQLKVDHAIKYRNLFVRYALKHNCEQIIDNIASFIADIDCTDLSPVILERNKLRNKLFRTKLRARKLCKDQVKYSDLYANPQMENADAHGDGTITKSISENVILTDARDSSGANIPRIPRWFKMNTEDTIGSFSEMVDRWFIMDKFQWTAATAKETKLKLIHLPNAILANDKLKDLISLRPFYNHRLWRGDMELKIEVNSNKFQVGQLQCSFYYGLRDLKHSTNFTNVVTLSQCNHGLIDAGGSNSVILNVPFKNHSVMLSTAPISELKQFYLGTLCIYVLNKLRVPEGVPDTADVVINFRFKNCEFSGQIPANFSKFKAMPEMEAMAMAGAMKLLDTALSDNNRDNPPAVLPPQYIVPTATHSWSIATGGVDPLHSLRFDQAGQTHHPVNSDLDQHNTVGDIIRTYTYFQQNEWKRATNSGEHIAFWSVSPDYIKSRDITNNKLFIHNLSALQVMSNQFMQWRGSIEYRFDIIASQFHTGRLLVAFVPMYTGGSAKLEELLSCPNVQIDLQESRSFTFVVPYVHIDAWMRRHAQMDGLHSSYTNYGMLYLTVINKLNCPNNVSDTIDINVYVRAGSSFELSVPVQPSIGLSYVADAFTPSDDIFPPTDGMSDAYLGTWSGYQVDDIPVVRWGTLPGRVAEYPKYASVEHSGEKIYFQADKGLEIEFVGRKHPDNADKTYNLNITIFAIINIGGFYVAFPFDKADEAVAARSLAVDGNGDWKKKYAYHVTSITRNPFLGKPLVLKMMVMGTAEGERDLTTELLDATNSLMPSNFGGLMYGESFNRLKDLCRRYQLYAKVTWDPNNLTDMDGFYILRVPIIPTGLVLSPFHDGSVDLFSNKCRDGMIPIILSGFRFYRGSIRFRIVFHDNDSNISAWVQHRPEMVNEENIQFVREHQDNMPMMAHGYASYVQCTDINNVIEVEFPFYQPGMYGILGRPISNTHRIYASNGVALIGLRNNFSKKMHMTIHYCLGDDFNFNTFQGFPQMVNAANITADAPKLSITDKEVDDLAQLPFAYPQDGGGGILGWLLGTDQITENVKTTIASSLKEVVQTYKDEGLWPGSKAFFCFLINQIVHIIANFSIKTICISIISIFSFLGVQLYDKIEMIGRFLSVVFKKFFPGLSEQPNAQEKFTYQTFDNDSTPIDVGIDINQTDTNSLAKECLIVAGKQCAKVFANCQDEINDDKESVAGWFSLCFTVLTTAMGCHDKGLKFDCSKAAGDFLSAKHLKAGSSVHTFVKLNYRVLFSMFDFVRRKIDPSYYVSKLFKKDTGIGQLWLTEVRELLTITLTSPESFEATFSDRVDCALVVGRELMDRIAASDINDLIKQLGGFERRFEKLTKLRNDLNRRGQYSYRRPKPIHVQLFGNPGLGKTVFTDLLSDFLLKEVCGFSTIPINKICSIKASSKFWDQCTGTEPVVLLDDLWAYLQTEILTNQITNYIELYGDTIFSPPKADVDEKNMRYAPSLILSTTNTPWVTIPGVKEDAIWRRMDALVEVLPAELDPVANPGCDHCRGVHLDKVKMEHLEDFHHLRFRIAERSKFNTYKIDLGVMTWAQLKHYLKTELKPIFDKNQSMYYAAVERAFSNAGMSDEFIEKTIQERIDQYRREMTKEWKEQYTSVYDDLELFKEYISERTNKYCNVINSCCDRFRKMLPTAKAEDETGEASDMFNAEEIALIDKSILRVACALTKDERTMIQKLCLRANQRHANGQPLEKVSILTMLDAACTCRHLTRRCLDGSYERGDNDEDHFITGNSLFKIGTCNDWCVLTSEALVGLYRNEWIARKPHRRIMYRNRKYNLLPKFCAPDADEEIGFALKLKNTVANFIDSQLAENSTTRKIIKLVKYVFKTTFRMIMRWLPILLALIGGVATVYGGYHAWQGHKEMSGWLNERRNVIQNETLEYMKQHNIPIEDKMGKEWFTGAVNTRLNREIHMRKNMQINDSTFGYAPPLGMIGFPQYNHYASEAPRVPKIIGKKPVPTMAIGQASSQQLVIAQERVKNNAVWIKTRYIDSTGNIVENKFLCTMLRAQQMLSIRHYWERWMSMPKETEFYFSYVEKPERIRKLNPEEGVLGYRINLLECDRFMLAYENDENGEPKNDCNWDIIELPKQIEMAPDITKFFATREQHSYVKEQIYFVRPGESTVHCLPMTRNPHRIAMAPIPGGKTLLMEETYLYDRHAPGYCGSAILSGSLQRPIIGFHVAEWNNKGCAEPIYGEVFNTKPTPQNPVVDICQMPLLDVDLSKINIDTVIYPKGVVPEILASSQSAESQFVPSIAQGEIYEVKTQPMPLSAKDPRVKGHDPLKLGCEKHGKVPKDFPLSIVRIAADDLKKKIIALCKPVRKEVGVLTLQEAICGNPNVPAFTALNWSSSEGFPLTSLRPANVRGKTHLFKLKNHMDGTGYLLEGMDPELHRLYSSQMEMRKNGIRPDTVFINCLKDEVREIEKGFIPGKTRVFSTSPIQYIIPYRQYFSDFNAAYKSHRIYSEHAIGINPDGPEWTELALYLQKQGKHIIAGDYKHFGDTLMNNVMFEAFEIMRAWYDEYNNSETHEEDQIVRGVLISEAMSVKKLSRNFIYQSLCGMASGFPATDVLNSMVNSIYLRVAWIMITGKSMKEFNENCNPITYGDDVDVNVSDEYADIYNTQTLQDFFAKYDIGFTDCDKSGEVIPLRTIETATFLKRHFVKHPHRPMMYLAKIDELSIGSCLNWTISKDDPVEAFICNADSALNLAYGHGPEYYEKLRATLTNRIAKEGKYFTSLSWTEYDARAFAQTNKM